MTAPTFDDFFRANHRRVLGSRREAALAHRSELQTRLRHLESRLRSMHDERFAIVDRLTRLRDRLWPRYRHGPRRFPAVDERPDPPIRADAQSVSGRPLRAACLAILQRHDDLPLRELAGLLHRYGYEVAGPRPVQSLSDAMRYETVKGRARRLRRGVYGLTPLGERAATVTARALATPQSWAEHPDDDERPSAVVDPALRNDPDAWIPTPWTHPAVSDLDNDDDSGVVRGEELLRQHLAARDRIDALIRSTNRATPVPAGDPDHRPTRFGP